MSSLGVGYVKWHIPIVYSVTFFPGIKKHWVTFKLSGRGRGNVRLRDRPLGWKGKKGGGGRGSATNRGAARVLTSELLPFRHILKPFRGFIKNSRGCFSGGAVAAGAPAPRGLVPSPIQLISIMSIHVLCCFGYKKNLFVNTLPESY